MATEIHGRFTPVDMQGIAQLMREYPNVYVITDTKSMAHDAIQREMRELCRQLGPD